MNRLVNIVVVLASLLLTLLLVEVAARVFDKLSPPLVQSWLEHRLSKPAPYKNASYDFKKIIDEARQVGWKTDENFGYLPNDFVGNYINIQNGYRKTTGEPASPKQRVWFFGGSTVFCLEVPDNLTLPSQFGYIANQKYGNRFKVINSGATSVTSRHQLYRLRVATDIKKGDIVIFMDGINEISQTLYHGNPTGNMIQHNREQIKAAGLTTKAVLIVYDKIGPYSKFVSRFMNPFKPSYLQVELSSDLLMGLENDYFTVIKLANEYVKSKGGVFYHFLQPNLHTVDSLTAYEEELLSNPYIVPINYGEVVSQGYPRLRRATERAQKLGIHSFDITTAFDQRTSEIFLDNGHVNEVGNEILAREIFNRMSPTLSLMYQ